ncbi:MAG TPA: hypothetical protein VK821_18820 [Dehalococcoidia bacterium]|nr:hypothetical protein [Dehalococcoidia bacterium]
MSTAVIVIIVALVVLGAMAAWFWTARQRSARLHKRFGPEYERTVARSGDRGKAEKTLQAREERVEKLDIQPLAEADRSRFADAWRSAQAQFVDDPPGAIREADRLVGEAMQARGYPVGNFEQRAADVSVDHPQVVSNYRAAHATAASQERGEAGTDDLRQAMLHYRELFDELLGSAPTTEATPTEARR